MPSGERDCAGGVLGLGIGWPLQGDYHRGIFHYRRSQSWNHGICSSVIHALSTVQSQAPGERYHQARADISVGGYPLEDHISARTFHQRYLNN